MSIAWSNEQRSKVRAILGRHPPHSGRCANAARAILPLARELDESARPWKIVPALPGAKFVMLKNPPPGLAWAHHITVEVSRHCVDTLPGVDGHLRETYLATFFEAPEHHQIVDVDLKDIPR